MMTTTSIPHRWKYDVFVSFRGEDIRKNFMDHLFKDFKQKGIRAFRDDNELPKGEDISPELYKAIEESRFLLVVFSRNYASSSWCLRELVKILECKQMEEHKHDVQIIFYDVKPDVVRKQTDSYAEAFAKHDVLHRTEVAKWRESLSMAANLSGWDLEDMANGYESKFIDSISKEILERLHHGPLDVGEHLVGVYARLDELNLLRFVGSNKVHIIGICGIGGIGKTTFAKAMYNKLCVHFEEHSFCENVQGTTKQHGISHVQMQLIYDIMKTRSIKVSNVSHGIMVIKQTVASKRILLVLDDVDHPDQIEALAGSRCWFFPGSVIIFTCKDKQLLSSYKVDEIHDMGYLRDNQALELFSLHAFGVKRPTKDFEELADEVVRYVQGHPLALKVLGRFLCTKTMSEWRSELDRLQVYPNEEIQNVLRLSFDGLASDQKIIFLDIACAFIGEKKDFAISVLESCTQFPQTNIRVLVDRSLITISSSHKLQMHDLIQIMAREIVREEANMNGKRSRLQIQLKALTENEVAEAIEVLVLLLENSTQKVHIDGKAFSNMKNLRILKIYDPKAFDPEDFNVSYTGRLEFNVNYTERSEFLSNKLIWLCWHGCPFKFFPSEFYPEKIVAIDLSYSGIKNLWTKPKCFRRLKVMKLRHCHNLTSTPDFTKITNLEELYLDGCVNLVKAHPSVGMLKRLVVLSMQQCKRLESFHFKFEMESLQVMDLSGCSKVDTFPEFVCTFKNLMELRVYGTGITELPSFVSSINNLQVLSFGRHEGIVRSRRQTSILQFSCFSSKLQHPQSFIIPSLAGSIRKLELSHCDILIVPDSIGGLSCLEYLCLRGNDFTSLPGSLRQHPLLRVLIVDGCKKLESLSELSPYVIFISANDCTSLQKVPTPLKDISLITFYYFRNCPRLLRNINPSQELGSRNRASSFLGCLLRQCISELMSQVQIPRFYKGMELVLLHGNMEGMELVLLHRNMGGIPGWYGNQSKGNDEVKVELPQSYVVIGYATCIVFTSKKPYNFGGPGIVVKNHDGAYLENKDPIKLYHSYQRSPTAIIWLYYSTDMRRLWEKAKDFITFSIKENKEEYEVKEWGVRVIWEEDEEEIYMDFIRVIEELPTLAMCGCLLMSVDAKITIIEW